MKKYLLIVVFAFTCITLYHADGGKEEIIHHSSIPYDWTINRYMIHDFQIINN